MQFSEKARNMTFTLRAPDGHSGWVRTGAGKTYWVPASGLVRVDGGDLVDLLSRRFTVHLDPPAAPAQDSHAT